MAANQRVVEVKDANRIAEFQLNMALETEALELDSPLVHQAVEYLIGQPQYGYYLANRNSDGVITGSLLCTFENNRSWWIQSVYVAKEFRKQGIFTSLFHTLIKLAKEQSVKQVSLYAESNNQRALQTYTRLGMHVTEEVIYGYDLVYSLKGYELLKQSLWGKPVEYVFEAAQKAEGIVAELGQAVDVLESPPSVNKQIRVYDFDKRLCMYAEYFDEFSDWRFGRIIYVSCLVVRQGIQMDVLLPQFVNWAVNNLDGLKIQAVRFISARKGKEDLTIYLPGIEQLHYLMVRINL